MGIVMPIKSVMAANALLDRGWGKAAQLVAVDGEIRQLVEVRLSVVAASTDARIGSSPLPAALVCRGIGRLL